MVEVDIGCHWAEPIQFLELCQTASSYFCHDIHITEWKVLTENAAHMN